MRVATFNAENLFSRPKVMNLETWDEGRGVLNDVQSLNGLLAKEKYTTSVKSRIKAILDKYEFQNKNKRGRPFEVVQVREKLFVVRRSDNQVEVVAEGRASWSGWVHLERDKINGEAIDNTGRVIGTIQADILCLIEVEDRICLDMFNAQVLSRHMEARYPHNLLVDGNDSRGIDIGLLSRYPIVSVRSHIDDGGEKLVFSRDCPEYEVLTPTLGPVWVLGNHFKSKGYGGPAESNAKRKRQAEEVARIYKAALERSDYVVVAGDLNDTPDSEPLRPLLEGTNLRDVMSHPSYEGPLGTYRTSRQKIDYVLLSPALWERVQAVGVERGGIYAPRAGNPFDTVTSLANQASDHAAVWVDLDV